ncbi:hypothetical protein CQA38_06960 [Campylobacter sp. MIT 12-5580]|uniref:hypothetical protein n=1 Tax=Campylobacter sp. MIT 12-5580 TaxID=2040651 RepID=UPI0010F5D83C|nr:hypothetical protein [Campylobacter sp. MIT 12-5580]TKX28613.1 hypothetical protein CQA38_06960 [Campylobacter sp. MIT 12-5580]
MLKKIVSNNESMYFNKDSVRVIRVAPHPTETDWAQVVITISENNNFFTPYVSAYIPQFQSVEELSKKVDEFINSDEEILDLREE